MVKIEEIEEQWDADRDEDCYEIDPDEFTKKLNLKVSDDVLLVATKGPDFVKTLDGYDSEGDCFEISNSGNRDGNLCESTGGDDDCNDEDETSLDKAGNDESKCVLERCAAKYGTDDYDDDKCVHGDEECCPVINEAVLVKCEIDDHNNVQGVDEDSYDHCFELYDFIHAYPKHNVFDEDDEDDVVVVGREAL